MAPKRTNVKPKGFRCRDSGVYVCVYIYLRVKGERGDSPYQKYDDFVLIDNSKILKFQLG